MFILIEYDDEKSVVLGYSVYPMWAAQGIPKMCLYSFVISSNWHDVDGEREKNKLDHENSKHWFTIWKQFIEEENIHTAWFKKKKYKHEDQANKLKK